MKLDISRELMGLVPVRLRNDRFRNINALSSRAAMGLPPGAIASVLDNLDEVYANLRNCGKDELVLLTRLADSPLEQRYVAGQLLGVLGDPRLDTLNPPMCDIPAGQSVQIGLPWEKVNTISSRYAHYGVRREWILKECPQHSVNIAPFRLGKYLVSNREYLQFLLETGHPHLPCGWKFGVFPDTLANHPVHGVSTEDIDAYILWLGKRTGRMFRLPTEYEWEYAAGGPDHLEFPWGGQYRRDHANTLESGILRTTPVGIFPLGAAPFGNLDMAGNVEEYVADDYAPYPGSDWVEDDLTRQNHRYRIARGGSFSRFCDLARTRRRHGHFDSELYVMGFRLAESLGSED